MARVRQAIDAAFHLSAVVESSDDAIISKDLKGVITSWNKGAERIFGYREDEVVGRPVTILIPPERADEELRILSEIAKGNRIDHYDTVRRRKDGSDVDISLTISPIRDDGGNIVGASKIARDVTQQRRDHELLRRSEELVRVTLASIGDAVISTDREGRVTFMNPVAEALTGWRQQEAIGRPLETSFTIISEVSRQPVENPVTKVLRQGVVVGMGNDTVLVARDGAERLIDDSAAPIRNTTGDLIGVVLAFRDVTERRTRELAAHRLAAIVESSEDAIYATTPAHEAVSEGIVQHWNRGAERLYGYSAGEMIGKPMTPLIPPELHAQELEILAMIRRGQPIEAYETRRLTKDGRQVDVSLTASPVKDAHGRLIGVSRIARDVTERRQAEATSRENEAMKTGVLNAAPDAVITFNQATEVIEFNPSAERMFGYARRDVVGKRIGDLIVPPAQREAYAAEVARYLSKGEGRILDRRIEVQAIRADGSEFPCELAVVRVPVDGPPLFTAFVRDISERKRDEAALLESEERFRTLADNISQMAWIADEKGSIFWFNKRWYEYTGTTLEESRGWGWKAVHHPDHVDRVVVRIQRSWDTGEPWEDTFPLRDKDGTYGWFLSRALPIRDAEGRVLRWLGTHTDVTEQRAAEDALRHGALHDALTELPNRAYFLEQVSQAIARARREAGYRFAVLLLDCDGFKAVNDSIGHAAGDRFLTAIAGRLRSCVRPDDVVARLGGDEFTVLLGEVTGLPDVENAARRIQDSFAASFELEGREIVATASIGAVLHGPDYRIPEDLLRDADLAMYNAKQRGRGHFQLFDVALRDSTQARVDMEADLRSALSRGEFRLVFQPIVELETGQVRALEALVRWHRAKRTVVTPLDFIALAEQTGLILPIGRRVLEEACRCARAWQDVPGAAAVRISVNLSAKQLRRPDALEEVESVFHEAGVSPSSFSFEIAERVLMEDIELSETMVRKLRDLGSEVYMDDVGTAHSPLATLPLLPLQGIKLDHPLVHRMGTRRTDLEIVHSIVDLAKTLRLTVVAEGVETIAQRERLIAFGCQLGQGHLFAEPLDEESARGLLDGSGRLDLRSA